MGSFGEDPNKVIDTSVGGLVWVRRRNGSWWPGRIVGLDELPEGSMSTPRSGTPVKLLGREDASVDWYNLERSKRVKPFRCGEYNDCIEKAKASASLSHPSKKSIKYARREEAIVEALELERARLGEDCPELDTQDSEQHCVDESPSLKSNEPNEDIDEDLSGPKDESNSAPEVSQSGVSFEEANRADAVMEESKHWRTLNDSEDDGIEGAKRMRGLEDLGMGVPPPKRKRSQVAVNDFSKRKSRRRTLTKVLECTAMVPVPDVPEKLSSPTRASEVKVSGLDSKEFKLNNSLVINNNSDSTGVSCDNPISLNTSRHSNDPSLNEEKNSAGLSTIVSGALPKTHAGAGAQSSQSSHVETASLGNGEHNDSDTTSSSTADIHNIGPGVVDKGGASKWQLKGKRNSRSRKTDMDDEAETCATGTDWETRGWNWNAPQRQQPCRPTAGVPAAPQRVLPCRQSRFTVNPKYDAFEFSMRHHIAPSGLYDIPVEVRASHGSQHVPFISLMSKSYGQPIIGHPVTVEVLDDGSCNELITFSECHSSNSEREYKNPSNISSATRGAGMAHKRKVHGRPPRTRRGTKSRRNTASSKKVRRLSSLNNLQREDEAKLPLVEKIRGPSVACVPLKVVFSRINAALNS